MFRLAAAALLAGLFLLAPADRAHAGKFNKVLKIGDVAPTWAALTGVDGKKSGLTDLKSQKVVVMVVTCNTCPMSVAYEDRMIKLARKWNGKDVSMVAINCNVGAENGLAAMKTRAKGKGFNFAYLADPSQKVGRAYGATRTPEFFVIGKDRKIVYMGALDDSEFADEAKVNYVDLAIQAALAGKTPAVTETAARGCGVPYED